MMSKTHLSVGMAAALAVSPFTDINSCLLVLAGGAIGGVIPDVDILDDDYKCDALIGELISFGLLALAIFINHINKISIIGAAMEHKWLLIIGGAAFLILWLAGFSCDHRDFTHSLLSMALFTASVALIYLPLTLPFAMGYLSHLLLDILNKKKIRLLFPREGGICLGLCYASKIGNTVFMILGFIATAFLLVYRFINLH
jgi:inner membrane protein